MNADGQALRHSFPRADYPHSRRIWHASRVVLTSGQKIAKGSVWQFLASAIFTAFAFEAYLNHVGPKVYAHWDDVERLSPLAKLDLICHFLDVKLVTQGAELSAIKELFDFRNKIAHGRTRTIRDTKVMRPEDVDLYFSDTPYDTSLSVNRALTPFN